VETGLGECELQKNRVEEMCALLERMKSESHANINQWSRKGCVKLTSTSHHWHIEKVPKFIFGLKSGKAT